ncbi:MAG TPA: hypothetical protein VN934_01965 [Candidatus Tumulicola sp.]|nr:hypothetical protein [Candidatus Tumulicola sp.]
MSLRAVHAERAHSAPDWSRYTAEALAGRLPRFDHCLNLFDRFGMVQFARGAVRDLTSGYCLDDNARALIVATLALALKQDDQDAAAIGRAALRFVETSQRADGAFHNLMDEHGDFTDEIGSPDSIGRAAWACGVTMSLCPRGIWREAVTLVLERSLPHLRDLEGIRPRGYALLGLCHAAKSLPQVRPQVDELALDLASAFEANASDEWPWWEPELTWGNGRLPEAMLRAFEVTGEQRYRDIGMRSLNFLASVTQPQDTFLPIGNDGWYVRGKRRPLYDQQPIEACGMVDAWLAAAKVTADSGYRDRALRTFEWFFGNNSDGLMVAHPQTGGCCDGLKHGSLNQNMGAESTLSYLHAHLSIAHG